MAVSSTANKGTVTFRTGSAMTQATVFLYKPGGQNREYGDDFQLNERVN